jgi:hypothetical protein
VRVKLLIPASRRSSTPRSIRSTFQRGVSISLSEVSRPLPQRTSPQDLQQRQTVSACPSTSKSLGQKHHLILDSTSDVFTPTGRTTIHVKWELSMREIDRGKCEFANRVRSYATEEFLIFLARQAIPFDQFRSQRPLAFIAHNQSKTLLSQLALSERRS